MVVNQIRSRLILVVKMRNRNKVLLGGGVILIALLFIPVKFHIKDGGSYGYKAIAYEVTVW